MKRLFALTACLLLLPGCTAALGGQTVVEYDPIVVNGQDSVEQAINEYDAQTVDYQVWHLWSEGVGSDRLYTHPSAPENINLPDDWLEQLPGEAELSWQQAATRAEGLRMALGFPTYEGVADDSQIWRLQYWPAAFNMAGPRAFYLCLYDPNYFLYNIEGFVSDSAFTTNTLIFEVPLAFGIDSVTGAVLFMSIDWPWYYDQKTELSEYLDLYYELDFDDSIAQPVWMQEWTDPDTGPEKAAALAEILGYSGQTWQSSIQKRINSTLWAINNEAVLNNEDSLYPSVQSNWQMQGWFAFMAELDKPYPACFTFFPGGTRLEFLAEGVYSFGVDHTPFWLLDFDFESKTWVKY